MINTSRHINIDTWVQVSQHERFNSKSIAAFYLILWSRIDEIVVIVLENLPKVCAVAALAQLVAPCASHLASELVII